MTATTITPGELTAPSQQAIPMSRLVRVELRKVYDTRAGKWLLGITAGVVTAVIIGVMIVGLVQELDFSYGTFVATTAYSSSIFLPILGMLLVTQEWGQRTGMVTFTLVPHRGQVIWAKLIAGLLLTLVAAGVALVVGAVANVVFSAAGSTGGDWDLGAEFLGGFLLAQTFAMLTGFAFATLLLNTPAAIVLYFVYAWVLPIPFAVAAELVGWFKDIRPWIDFNAAQTPLVSGEMKGDDWPHLAVSGIFWLVIPVVIGLIRVFRAEVK